MKVQANELRIGNLVLDDEGNIVVIECITSENAMINGYSEENFLFSKKDYPLVLFYSEIEPIPLSDEWLRKTEAQLQPWGWVLNGFLIRTNHKDKFWVELGNGKRIELPYVHSLQNFFTIANEELTFKL